MTRAPLSLDQQVRFLATSLRGVLALRTSTALGYVLATYMVRRWTLIVFDGAYLALSLSYAFASLVPAALVASDSARRLMLAPSRCGWYRPLVFVVVVLANVWLAISFLLRAQV